MPFQSVVSLTHTTASRLSGDRPGSAEAFELRWRHAELPEDLEEERRLNFPAAVKWNGDRSPVAVAPPFVTARLTSPDETERSGHPLLGMHDLGRVLRQGRALVRVFLRDQVEDPLQFCQGGLAVSMRA